MYSNGRNGKVTDQKSAKVTRYESNGARLCKQAEVRLGRGIEETTVSFPRLYVEFCDWERCILQRGLLSMLDFDLLQRVGSRKSAVNDMGTRGAETPASSGTNACSTIMNTLEWKGNVTAILPTL
jgi:hypothetical protein